MGACSSSRDCAGTVATSATDGAGGGSASRTTEVTVCVDGSVGIDVEATVARGCSVTSRCNGTGSWITGVDSVMEGIGGTDSGLATATTVAAGTAVVGLPSSDARNVFLTSFVSRGTDEGTFLDSVA